MNIPQMAEWGKKKGIDLLATTDWTHPLWLKELKANLKEAGEGVYRAKSLLRGGRMDSSDGGTERGGEPHFILGTEISSIYSQGGKGRRIHNLVFAPNFKAVEKINAEFLRRGFNLMSDGRPIIGFSSRDLVDLVMSIDENCLIIPAHVWTPWFSLYGSKSGFDSIKECFQDMSKYIYAIETGLSSSPEMNWRIKDLDKRSIVSFSDAHSPEKIGREATILKVKNFNYLDIKKAIQKQSIVSTIEFYPEEGKYHYTGHRKCSVCQSPKETKKLGISCPVCGKPLTIGVMHRVEQLANRPTNFQPKNRPPYKMLVPLMEILAEALRVGVSSQKVVNEYNNLIKAFGSELEVLTRTKPEEIIRVSNERVSEGVLRVRSGQVIIEPGYDGVFGTVKIWPAEAEDSSVSPAASQNKQISLL